MNLDGKNDDYFEIKKISIEEFDKQAKKEKAGVLRRSIAVAVMSVATSAILGTSGYNPFLAFAQLYTLPIAMVVISDIKILSKLKQKRMQIMNESRYDNMESENINRGKKL
ncbi:MAG: hypothetical protein IJ568_01360 [Bacilli bacterium]|nr:hypothetical protein [Bacilli bacterium]